MNAFKVGYKTGKFMDSLRILVQGGAGGMGLPKFGGIGGKGGDVIIKASSDQNNLKQTVDQNPTRRVKAFTGENSRSFRIVGAPGKNRIIYVPTGLTVTTEFGNKLGELNLHNEELIIAKGGFGGCFETQFAGQAGEKRMLNLLLSLIADVGLVGFPNAGKSTLLRAISYAKPKIASYPFTTLTPQIGVMNFEDDRIIKMADLPGLIEGAWTNIGMGHKFLRHVERTNLLLFFVDINGFQLGPRYPHRSAIETIILLNRELELYNPELTEKPSLLVLNKMDTENASKKSEEVLEQLKDLKEISKNYPVEMQPERFVNFDKVLCCSAKKDVQSVINVKHTIRELLDENDKRNEKREEMMDEARKRIKHQHTEHHLRLM